MKKKLHQMTALVLAFLLIFTSADLSGVMAAEKNGSYITVSKSVYCITKMPSGTESGEAVLMKWGGSNTKASVKEKITYKKKIYKVVGVAGVYKGKKKAKSVFGASVKKVSLPDTISLIGANTFNGCKKLTSLTIPKNVEKIEKKAVNNCPKLKKIVLKSRDIAFPADGAFTKINKKAVIYIPTGLSVKDAYKTKVKKQLTAGGQVKYNLSKPEVKAVEDGELLENKSVQENKITLKGVAFSNRKIKKVTYQVTDETNKEIASGNCRGTAGWTIACTLKDGTNAIKITAEDSTGKKGSSTVYVVKVDDEVTYGENVRVESTETSQAAAESITDIESSEDSVYITVENDSEILSYIENGSLKEGDVYLLQPNDEMPTGFAGIFEGVTDEQGKKVIQFTSATLGDLYKNEDVTIDLSGGIDADDPVAFAYLPDGTKIDMEQDGNSASSAGHAQLRGNVTGQLSGSNGSINISLREEGNAYALALGLDDIVLYDRDKNEDTTNDQLKLSGSYTISDFQSEFYFDNKGLTVRQCYSKIAYQETADVQLKMGAELNTADLVQSLNGGFENKRKIFGLQIEGIDLSDSIMLGVVGINLKTSTPVVSTFRTLKKTSEKRPSSPVAFVAFILHLDGTISTQVMAGFSETSYNEKGINLQKKGYIGKYGAFDPSKGKSKDILGYHLQIIDRTGKNRTDMSGTSKRTLYLECDGNASLEVGAGIMGAIMAWGIIPAAVSAYPYYKAEGAVSGRLEVGLPEMEVNATGEYHVKEEVGITVKGACSVTKNLKGSLEFSHTFWEKNLAGKPKADDKKKPDNKNETDDKNGADDKKEADDKNGADDKIESFQTDDPQPDKPDNSDSDKPDDSDLDKPNDSDSDEADDSKPDNPEPEIVLTNTEGKNAKDVEALRNIIQSHKEARLSTDLNDYDYDWDANGNLYRLYWKKAGLKGRLSVQGLSSLKTLYCYNNQLSSLEISKCKNLEYLDCNKNQLSSLKISMCKNLEELDCNKNQLSSLDVSECKNLLYLNCYNNELSSLDVSKCKKLEYLYCGANYLSSLDVSMCKNLEELSCHHNELSSLNVSKCKNLEYLDCNKNQLSSLDVSKCKNLEELYCNKNQLSSLDVSKCNNLEYLQCSDNQLSSLDVSKCKNLEGLCCDKEIKVIGYSGNYQGY